MPSDIGGGIWRPSAKLGAFRTAIADEDVMGPQLIDLVADSFAVAVPVMRWLAAL